PASTAIDLATPALPDALPTSTHEQVSADVPDHRRKLTWSYDGHDDSVWILRTVAEADVQSNPPAVSGHGIDIREGSRYNLRFCGAHPLPPTVPGTGSCPGTY